ncbi:MAG: tRNA dihydrouridine synthase DusB [Acidobacteriota bacterium]
MSPLSSSMKRESASPERFPGPALAIGDWVIRPNLVMAPLAGLTDPYFRAVIRDLGGCGLIVTEMVSSEALTRGNPKALKMLKLKPRESPVSIQVIGGDPARMARAAAMAQEAGADFVDVNMGCPVRKVVKGNAGAALMRDGRRAEKVLLEMKGALSVPLTVKIRAGWNHQEKSAPEMARLAQDCGVAAISVHPRSRAQAFRGTADWSVIREVKEAVSIPVVGNGDVRSAADAQRMERETGCDGVIIGRGALMNPFIFNEILSERSGGVDRWPAPGKIKTIILRQFRAILEGEPEKNAMHKMRSFAGWYSRGVPGGAELRRRISGIRDPGEFISVVEETLSDRSVDLDPQNGPSYNPVCRGSSRPHAACGPGGTAGKTGWGSSGETRSVSRVQSEKEASRLAAGE